MRTCPQCDVDVRDRSGTCGECGATLESTDPGTRPLDMDAVFDPETERERFERRFGIDIGDRTVDEYLQHLSQQDYSLTVWVGVIALVQVVGIGLFVLELIANVSLSLNPFLPFTILSIVLAVGIFADTRVVGQFRPWAKIRWTYVIISAIPLVGHIAGFLYLLLRRLMHERTDEYRRRFLNASGTSPHGVPENRFWERGRDE